MLDHWLIGQDIITKRNVELEETSTVVGGHIPGEKINYTSLDIVENKN